MELGTLGVTPWAVFLFSPAFFTPDCSGSISRVFQQHQALRELKKAEPGELNTLNLLLLLSSVPEQDCTQTPRLLGKETLNL